MILLDVNVVVAMARADHPHHAATREWFDEIIRDGESFGVPSTVWACFLRLVTNRRVFDPPSSIEEAFEFVEAVAAQPDHVRIEPGPPHLDLLRTMCDSGSAAGDLVPDAALAATAKEHAATLASFDRDFARFPDLDWIVPGS